MDSENNTQKEPLRSESKLPERVIVLKSEYMMNKIDLENDPNLQAIFEEIKTLIDDSNDTSLNSISQVVRSWCIKRLNDRGGPELADAEIFANQKPLVEKFLNERQTTLLGDWFDPPANVCQQNVLLLNAVSAYYGHKTSILGFTYKGKQSGSDRVHVVGMTTNSEGNEIVMDPTLIVDYYGADIGYVPLEEYIARFDSPSLSQPIEIFSPKETTPPDSISRARNNQD